ncbi:MAG TPA: glycoside hydrolase family 15 protein [Alphaproteobacteria bacterium]|jgi:GH15 family glucan-1,4-alpha-glucosidase|nr:glycoside hydrolase family 15 protein [Alphaproteobacteria bacterium]
MQTLDLAVIGNSVISALIDRNGRHVWHCHPRLDADPIFCLLVDNANGGFMDVEIEDFTGSEQAYVQNTAILETTLKNDKGGSLRIIDFAPRFKQFGRIFRPAMIVRRIEPDMGRCRIRVRVKPRFNYGADTPQTTRGSNHIRFWAGETVVRMTTDGPITYIAEDQWFVLDHPINLILGPDETIADSVSNVVRGFLEHTEDYWKDWVRYLSIPFEWQQAVIRAAITLKLCAFEESGGIVAAMTTSIPEGPEDGRGWDYRFCWVRDAYFVVEALNRLGATLTMEDFIRYVTDVAAIDPEGELKPVYGIIPGQPLEERELPHLPGYRGYGPVRVGNAAALQTQNDGYGNVILAATQMFFDRRLPKGGDVDLFTQLERLGERAVTHAFTPDAGLWEFRGRARIHTYSAVMCWAACDRLAKIAERLNLIDRVGFWQDHAATIRERVLAEAWNAKRGSFAESLGGTDTDASLLLLAEVGFIEPTDERFLGTVAAIEKDLLRGKNLFRYAVPDDFGMPTTAFNICTFWYIDALSAIGRKDEARAMFEELLSRRNHVGLLSEDVDPNTGELWGNFPQTYSMVGIIISAMRLSKRWDIAF